MNGPMKLIYLTLGIMCLVLGVVGLIIPILPGVLFLAGALYLLTRGSSRVKQMADEHPRLRSFQQRMEQMDAASMMQRAQVACLMTLQSFVSGTRKLFLGFRRMVA